MLKYIPIVLLLFISFASADNIAEDELIKYIASKGLLSSDLCWNNSPDDLYDRPEILKETNQKLMFLQSLAGRDIFFKTYASELQKVTNIKYPKALKYRVLLVSTFRQISQFIAKLNHGGGTGNGHIDGCLPAQVEWLIVSGVSEKFYCEIQGYIPDDLVAFSEILIRGKHLIQGPEDVKETKEVLRRMFAEAMTTLRDAEQNMDEAEKKYYRYHILEWLTKYI
jgi:hypothetical protein